VTPLRRIAYLGGILLIAAGFLVQMLRGECPVP
jgi:hypothetical protein